jgi:hypothetical protein
MMAAKARSDTGSAALTVLTRAIKGSNTNASICIVRWLHFVLQPCGRKKLVKVEIPKISGDLCSTTWFQS